MMCGLTSGAAWDNAKESNFWGSLSVIHALPLLPIVLHRCLWSLLLSHLKVKEDAELWLIHGLCFSLQLWRIWQTAELLPGCPAYLSSGVSWGWVFHLLCVVSQLSAVSTGAPTAWILPEKQGWLEKHSGLKLGSLTPLCVPIHELFWELTSARQPWKQDRPHPLLPSCTQDVSDTLNQGGGMWSLACTKHSVPGATPPMAAPAKFTNLAALC